MKPARIKLVLLVASLAAAAVVFLAWTQTWFTLPVFDVEPVVADGSVAAPALTALALAELALVGAAAIAGPVIRVVLAILQVLLGATIAFSSIVALSNPLEASASAVSEMTGVTGGSVELTRGIDVTAWPAVAVVGGIAIAVLGVLELLTSRAWPGSSRKYGTVSAERPRDSRSSVDDWDALSGGDDPTQPDDASR